MNRRRLTVGLAAAAVMATIAWASTAAASQHGHTQIAALGAQPGVGTPEGEVRATVEKALRVHQTVGIPPVANVGDQPTDNDLTHQRTQGVAAVHDVFADAPAAKEVDNLNRAIAVEANSRDHFRVKGGGIHSLTFNSVDMTDSTATVHATAEMWSKISMKTPDGKWQDATPQNALDVTMTLSNVSGKWVVQSFDWTFAPGSAP